MNAAAAVNSGKTYLGIEFGSTRIKAVLTDGEHRVLASGEHAWENRLEDGYWTYSLDEVLSGLAACYAELAKNVGEQYGERLTRVGCIGISAMMHGYLAFDEAGALLTPFRTWRNTTTGRAAKELSELFGFNIPQRWSIAHLYQAILDGQTHVKGLRRLTTLAGYIHWKLTGEFVLGVDDASGMFPIDGDTMDFDEDKLQRFDALTADRGFPRRLRELLPRVLPAGEDAGRLTAEGALLLDPKGALTSGIPFCPPEGDAGTGMVATNSVRVRTGNVSAGTSVFAMCVLERPLKGCYPQVDIVATPSGEPVAMVHCNNCTGELDAWVRTLAQAAEAMGAKFDTDMLYGTLYRAALSADRDCGGLLAYNYLSGEPVTGFTEGRPLLTRTPDAKLTLSNLMRAELFSAVSTLHIGMELLRDAENVALDSMTGHGGFFKVPEVGQRIMAAALNTAVTVTSNAGEGGPWGMAILAAYRIQRAEGETLADYLDRHVFAEANCCTLSASKELKDSFDTFIRRYKEGLPVEAAAIQMLSEE